MPRKGVKSNRVSKCSKCECYEVKSSGWCKRCNNIDNWLRRRTKNGFLSASYSSQKTNSKKRGHKPPEYSREEFIEYCLSLDEFHVLFQKWENSMYSKDLSPSMDRIDNGIGYTFNNISLCTFKENRENQKKSIIKGELITSQMKAVKHYDIKGELIATYYSAMDAQRKTGINQGMISRVCRGERNHTKNNIFKYV